MSDFFLIITPLVVLVVVLFLGFAGCEVGEDVPVDLTFRARLDSNLTAVDGVTFLWRRPGHMDEGTTVTSYATVGDESVFTHTFHAADLATVSGSWDHVACRMVAQDRSGGPTEDRTSMFGNFSVFYGGTWVYSFHASGRPLVDFNIENPDGLE